MIGIVSIWPCKITSCNAVGATCAWIDKNWSTHTAVGFTHLTGDAADSPLTQRKTTPMVMTGFSYKF